MAIINKWEWCLRWSLRKSWHSIQRSPHSEFAWRCASSSTGWQHIWMFSTREAFLCLVYRIFLGSPSYRHVVPMWLNSATQILVCLPRNKHLFTINHILRLNLSIGITWPTVSDIKQKQETNNTKLSSG